MGRPAILIVDDEEGIRSFLVAGLRAHEFEVSAAATLEEARAYVARDRPDLVILDLSLPDGDGLDFCAELQNLGNILVLMLTAADRASDRVTGLVAGADDYLVKPFDFRELVLRIGGLLRRRPSHEPSVIEHGAFILDIQSRTVTKGTAVISLTQREFDLFACFMLEPNQALTRASLLRKVWGSRFAGEPSVVDVYVRYLRAKLDPEQNHIQTVRSVGYRFVP